MQFSVSHNTVSVKEKFFKVKTMNIRYLHILLLLTGVILTGCKDNPVTVTAEPELSTDEVSCTEVWLELKLPPEKIPAEVKLLQDNQEIQNLRVFTEDTLLYVRSLEPSRNYTFLALITPPDNKTVFSNNKEIRTLTPSGRIFNFRKHYFGEAGFSYNNINDAAIINENDIWIAGRFALRDTNINGMSDYNAAHWDGRKWEYRQLWFHLTGGFTGFPEINKVILLPDDKIAFLSGHGIAFMKNGVQYRTDKEPLWTNAFWGTDTSNFYACGSFGKIYRYDGNAWHEIYNAGDITFYKIYGSYNKRNKSYEIIALAINPTSSRMFRIEEDRVTELSMTGVNTWVNSVWHHAGKKYFMAGKLLYKKNPDDTLWSTEPGMSDLTCIEGNGLNQIYAASNQDRVYQYDGVEWRYMLPTSIGTSYSNIRVKDNIVVTMGYYGNLGIVTIFQMLQ